MSNITIKKNLLFLTLFLLTCSAHAKNCGVIGTTYPIAEADLRQIIQERLLTLQQNGELSKLQNKFNQDVDKKMDRPQAVVGLKRTNEPHTRLFDPSMQFPYDIKNSDGQIVVPKGTMINPLDTVLLNETLIFYNADDPEQVTWAKQLDQQLKGKDKLILVKGSIIEQIKLFKKPLYFDQEGRLTKRFNLKQVPALISQQGNRLKIEEVQP